MLEATIVSAEKPSPLVFISYRRHDSAGAARWLYSAFQKTFGPETVFMDVEAIRVSDDWAHQIDTALGRATALCVVIGPHWLRIADEHGRRRLDREDDWVRNEIRQALERKIPIVPVLLSKTPLPEKPALPEPIQRMVDRQAFDLRDDRWDQDITTLVSEVESLGFRRRSPKPVRYPRPRVTLAELSPEATAEALRQLPGWELVTSEIPGREPLRRTELRRGYEFKSFEAAIEFMGEAAQHISSVEHHPRWENVWRTVTVWLTTWDIGSQPSVLDVDLARHLDQLFERYVARTTTDRAKP
jgi:pterin-4a-carbinolamine dehydratase